MYSYRKLHATIHQSTNNTVYQDYKQMTLKIKLGNYGEKVGEKYPTAFPQPENYSIFNKCIYNKDHPVYPGNTPK